MSLQDQLKAALIASGIPAQEVKVYGSQIMVTTLSRKAADEYASLIGRFAKVRKVWKTIDENKSVAGTIAKEYHDVWRVAGVLTNS